ENAIRGDECGRIEKGVAESDREPHQRSIPGQLELRYRPGQPRPECSKHPAGDSVQPRQRLEPHHPMDYADRLPAHSRGAATRAPGTTDRSVRIGRLESLVLLLAEEGQGDVGRRADIFIADSDQYRVSRTGEIRHRAFGGSVVAAGPLDPRV